ncbi:MAG: hemerythrin family protein [Fibrobacter sp.]|nr:hemerythrin family protein [Fibrobacter sp.]
MNKANIEKALKIEWNDEYSLGDPIIDKQHRTIIEYSKLVFETTEPKEVVRRVLDLYVYTRKHFSSEEQIMRERKFNLLSKHREQHNAIITRLSECMEEIKINPEKAHKLLHEVMSEWIIKHILTEDMKIPKP